MEDRGHERDKELKERMSNTLRISKTKSTNFL